MNKFLIILLIMLNLTQAGWAIPILVQTIPTPKDKPHFSGHLSFITNTGFEKVNTQIQRDLMTEDDTPIEFISSPYSVAFKYNLKTHQLE